MNFRPFILANACFLVFGLLEIIVINEEALLCLCFFIFVFTIHVFLGNDIFSSLDDKSIEIEKTFIKNVIIYFNLICFNTKKYSKIWISKSFYFYNVNLTINKLRLILEFNKILSLKADKKIFLLQEIWKNSKTQKNLNFFEKVFSLKFL